MNLTNTNTILKNVRNQSITIPVIFLISVTIFIYYFATRSMVTRSAWFDESMLLANFINNTTFDIFHPLGLYDQAASPFSIILLKLSIILLGLDLESLRYFIASIVLLGFSYFLYGTIKTFGLIAGVFVVILLFVSYELIYYSTEIKHYAFEIAGSFILLGWFYLYLNGSKKLKLQDVFILATGLYLGVSTLLIFLTLIIATSYFSYYEKNRRENFTIIFILCVIGISYKFLISYYTEFQVSNYPGAYSTTIALYKVNQMLHTLKSINHSSILAVFSLFYFYLFYFISGNKDHNLDNRNAAIILLSSIFLIVFFGSGVGVYPATYKRQLIWLFPVIISVISISISTNVKNKFYLIFLLGPALAYYFFSMPDLVADYQKNHNHTDNNLLYSKLSTLQPSNVLVHFTSQPSLDVYKNIYPELNSHTYLGIVSNASGSKIEESEFMNNFSSNISNSEGAWGSIFYYFRDTYHNFDKYSEWAVKQTDSLNDFYILFSHTNKLRKNSLLKFIDKRKCESEVYFTARKAEILKLHCKKETTGEILNNGSK